MGEVGVIAVLTCQPPGERIRHIRWLAVDTVLSRGFRHSGRRLRPLPYDDAKRGGGGCECSRLPSVQPITVATTALSS